MRGSVRASTHWSSDPMACSARTLVSEIVESARAAGLPVIGSIAPAAALGAMVSWSVDVVYMTRQGAAYADKILRGAKPADLPVEQPTKFELIINLKTAKSLGLTIPKALLLRADEVIE